MISRYIVKISSYTLCELAIIDVRSSSALLQSWSKHIWMCLISLNSVVENTRPHFTLFNKMVQQRCFIIGALNLWGVKVGHMHTELHQTDGTHRAHRIFWGPAHNGQRRTDGKHRTERIFCSRFMNITIYFNQLYKF